MASLRLRLQFHAPLAPGGIRHTASGDVCTAWWFLPHQVATVHDLANQIIQAYALQTQAQDARELLLVLDGFAIPHFSPISILRDGDLVHVNLGLRRAQLQPDGAAGQSQQIAAWAAAQEAERAAALQAAAAYQQQHVAFVQAAIQGANYLQLQQQQAVVQSAQQAQSGAAAAQGPAQAAAQEQHQPARKRRRQGGAALQGPGVGQQPSAGDAQQAAADTQPQAQEQADAGGGMPEEGPQEGDGGRKPSLGGLCSSKPSRSARRKAAKRKLRRLGVLPNVPGFKKARKEAQEQQQQQGVDGAGVCARQAQQVSQGYAPHEPPRQEPLQQHQPAVGQQLPARGAAGTGAQNLLQYAALASALDPNSTAWAAQVMQQYAANVNQAQAALAVAAAAAAEPAPAIAGQDQQQQKAAPGASQPSGSAKQRSRATAGQPPGGLARSTRPATAAAPAAVAGRVAAVSGGATSGRMQSNSSYISSKPNSQSASSSSESSGSGSESSVNSGSEETIESEEQVSEDRVTRPTSNGNHAAHQASDEATSSSGGSSSSGSSDDSSSSDDSGSSSDDDSSSGSDDEEPKKTGMQGAQPRIAAQAPAAATAVTSGGQEPVRVAQGAGGRLGTAPARAAQQTRPQGAQAAACTTPRQTPRQAVRQDGSDVRHTAVRPPVALPDFNSLPELQGAPRVGDVLAYKLLEISANFTPQVSAVRHGQVTQVQPAAEPGSYPTVTLAPWPDPAAHPLASQIAAWRQQQAGEEGDGEPAYKDIPFVEGYSEQGVLTSGLDSFTALRLVSSGVSVEPGAEQQQQRPEQQRKPGTSERQTPAGAHMQGGTKSQGQRSSRGVNGPTQGSEQQRQGQLGQSHADEDVPLLRPCVPGVGPPRPAQPRPAAGSPVPAVGAFAELAEQLRLRRQQLAAQDPDTTQQRGPTASKSVPVSPAPSKSAAVPVARQTQTPQPAALSNGHSKSSQGPQQSQAQASNAGPPQGNGHTSASTGKGAAEAAGEAGRIKPRAGARHGAVGPLLRLLRSRAAAGDVTCQLALTGDTNQPAE